jgi:hypothetical protein
MRRPMRGTVSSRWRAPAAYWASQAYVRGQRVLLDSGFAALWRVSTHWLNEAVKRNLARFPEDFAFRLDPNETRPLLSQSAISKPDREQLARRFEVFLRLS